MSLRFFPTYALLAACGTPPTASGDELSSSHGRDTRSDTGAASNVPSHTDSDRGDSSAQSSGSSGSNLGTDRPTGPEDPLPTLYPADQVHSPVTPSVLERMEALSASATGSSVDVFMKIGASSTVSHHMLRCFADPALDLGDYTHLDDALDFFLGGDAAGTTPFDRASLAAESGRHAGWATSGDPSPVDREIAAISPSLGLIHYGANDMGWGSTRAIAFDTYFVNMSRLLDRLEEDGIIPILTGISRRGDSLSGDRWVDAWNAAIRGMAQDRQVPFIDLELASRHLPGFGLSSDGLHLNSSPEGACAMTPTGLQYGYNVRNLIVLESLDRVHRTLDLGEPPPDAPVPIYGDGGHADPWEIDLPFSHVADTRDSPHRIHDVYDGCDAPQDESGPEYVYTFTLDRTTALRLAVADLGDADIDVHLLDETGTTAGCIARGHRTVEGTLPPGTYTVVLDTFVNHAGIELAGEYLFAAVECLPHDPACAVEL
ncbi:MAG: SGNH/GDSL hydrolase family protein [Deltaproteobacteria bacterium]|nr:MAG: SGNH/GDSL hydrolase family protein [Deltaproteobacteria bacterium]